MTRILLLTFLLLTATACVKPNTDDWGHIARRTGELTEHP